MLPTHRQPHRPPSESLSRLSKVSQPFNKLVTRWVILGCVVLGLLWLGGPLLRGMVQPGYAEYDYPPPPSQGRPTHTNVPSPPPAPTFEEQQVWEPRKDAVRDAFKHAWKGYKDRAMPSDELLSVSGGRSNKYNGWGVTLFDSLDTMWIMNLREEFAEAVASIKDLRFNSTKPDHYAPFFETTIRYLGGTLSAYALSGDKTLLQHANRLGELLLPAFDGTESGLPAYSVNVDTGKILSDSNKNTVLFAEATTCQLEFKYLAKLTGKKEYYQRVQTAMNLFYKADVKDGLFHENWLMKDGTPTGAHFTIGANADSGYEYMLKQWLQSGDPQAREQYIKSANGIIANLIYMTPKRKLLYVGDLSNGRLVHRLEHLSCYLPGVLALGASTLYPSHLTQKDKELHEWAAHGLAYTCAVSYLDQETGLGPDEMTMPTGTKWIDEVTSWKEAGRIGDAPGMGEPAPSQNPSGHDYVNNWPNAYLLRPETVESIFVMWRTTGDVKWRERGWKIFQAIEKHTKTEYGYSSVHGITGQVRHLDDMPSWFLAETLKYLYLLFDDISSITADNWIFNTEAHPLPVFEWTEEERKAFGIVL